MAIEYKNTVLEITSTGSDQVIYTCPTSTSLLKYMAIVKTFTVLNTTAGAGTVDIQLTDSILKINTSVQPANAFVSVMEVSEELRGV